MILKYSQQCESDIILSDIDDSTCLSFSCFLYIKCKQMEKACGYLLEAGKAGKARKAYELGHFINTFRAWFDCSNASISGMPYTSNTWVWWGERGELTCPIGTRPHTLCTILHVYHPPTYLLQIHHISLLCIVCDWEYMGI